MAQYLLTFHPTDTLNNNLDNCYYLLTTSYDMGKPKIKGTTLNQKSIKISQTIFTYLLLCIVLYMMMEMKVINPDGNCL